MTDCVVEDLRETEQVEDSHVDCAEQNAKVFGGGWSRVGQLQGKEIVGSSRVVIFSVWSHYGSDVLEQKDSRQDIDRHSIVWMCETGLTCLNRRQVARTLTTCNHLGVVQDPSKKRTGLGGVVVHRAVHVVDVWIYLVVMKLRRSSKWPPRSVWIAQKI